VKVNINENPENGNCFVFGTSVTSLGNLEYEIPALPLGNNIVVDYSLQCSKEKMGISIDFGFTQDEQTDLTFTPSSTLSQNLFISTRGSRTMTVNMTRVAGNQETILGGTSLDTLYMGEEYHIKITVGIMWADYNIYNKSYPSSLAAAQNHFVNVPVNVELPADLIGTVNPTLNCTYNSVSNILTVPMNEVLIDWEVDYGDSGYSDISVTNENNPCKLKFQSVDPVDPINDSVIMSYETNNPYYGWPDNATKTFSGDSLKRQDVTAVFGSPVVFNSVNQRLELLLNTGITETFSVSLTRQIAQSQLPPLDGGGPYFSFSKPAACNLMNTSETRISPTEAEISLSFPQTCAGPFVIVYIKNDWFNNSSNSIYVDITDPPPPVNTNTTPRFNQAKIHQSLTSK
jgi:hypothetical protein